MITVLYAILSIIFTFPLVIKLGDFLPGLPGDAYSYIWNIWIFWNQIFNGNNPFFTDMIIHPIGANLFFNTSAPLVSVFGLFFLKNLSAYLGILAMVSITLSSLSLYYLTLKLTKNRVASFIGGLIYGFSPIINSFIQSQHLYFLFSSIFYPLGLLELIKHIENNKNRHLVKSFLLFWIILSIDYYSAVLYSVLIFIFVLTNGTLNLNKILNYTKVTIITIVLPFCLIFVLQKNFNEFIRFKQSYNNSAFCSTNIYGFIIPNSSNPIMGDISEKIRGALKLSINLDTPSYFSGWGILLITLISALKYRKNKYICSLFFIYFIFFTLSLGTQISLGSKVILANNLTPFYYFIKIPILNLLGCPIRFPIIMQLVSAVLVAYFISRHKKYITASIAILLLFVIEYGNVNKDFSSISTPSVYENIYDTQNNKTVLEIPSGITESTGAFGYDWSIRALHAKQMYWQTVHEKPRIGGYVSRLTPEKYTFLKNEPVISDIFNYSSADGIAPKYNLEDGLVKEFIEKFNLGYIVLSPNNRQEEFSFFIEEEFGKHITEKIVSDGFILYKI